MKTMIVRINSKTGEVQVETDGYGNDSGGQCTKDAQPFVEALGEPQGPPTMKAQTTTATAHTQVSIL